MFNPNLQPSFSHRSQQFHSLYQNTIELFKDKFSISEDYDVLLLNCSGRVANEIIISSFIDSWKINKSNCKFQHMLALYASRYSKLDGTGRGYAEVLFETSDCSFRDGYKEESGKTIFLDCISAFPFYNPIILQLPCDVFTTVSSKQLGAQPVLSIIVIKKAAIHYFGGNVFSNLSFPMYYAFSKQNETPGTCSISLFQDFYKQLKKFNLQEANQKLFDRVKRFESIEHLCKRIGIVTKLDHTKIPKKLFSKYHFYLYENDPLLFLWSENDKKFDTLIRDLEEI
jgi:aspartate aminotransferase-like enzyme